MRFCCRAGGFVLLIGRHAFKVGLSPSARAQIVREAETNRLAQKSEMWRDLVVPVRRAGPMLFSPRYPAALPDHEGHVDGFIAAQLAALADAPRRPASELVDLAVLQDFQRHGLEPETVQVICDRLAALVLPASASHGDFFADNIVHREQAGIALIDWDSYRPLSSFLFDAVHYYLNQLNPVRRGKSWTMALFDDVPASPEIRGVLDRFSVPVNDGLLGYGVDRLAREVAQEGGMAALDARKRKKYRALCLRLAAA